MNRILVTFIIAFLFIDPMAAWPQGNPRDVDHAWDALLATKGGRQRLEGVESLLYEEGFGSKNGSNFVQLYVIPDYRWFFRYSPFKGTEDDFGVDIWNGRKAVMYHVGNRGLFATDSDADGDGRDSEAQSRVAFLLESKGDKPKPTSIHRIMRKGKPLEALDVIVGRVKLRFLFEPEEMLVSEVQFFDKDGSWFESISMQRYLDVSGIQMPTIVGYKYREKDSFYYHPVRFTFNVDYDPKIFEPPFKIETPDAWKKKTVESR